MSRTISSPMRQALWASESGEVLACLLTIEHEDLETPLYLSTDATIELTAEPKTYGTRSRGNDYLFLGVAVTLPPDSAETAPIARLELDNVDRSLVSLIRSVTLPATVTLELVLASDPDTVEITYPSMQLAAVTYDASLITFDLALDALFQEPIPGNSFTPGDFPGLF